MDSVTSPPPGQTATHPLGVGEPLPVVDLPEPEEVFGVPHLGRKEVVRFVLGPSLIALGISIGSGEWLLGPLNVGTLGFVGVGWIITVSALLQVFYNLEFSRYVLATGEVPIVGFRRVPPGALLWLPFSLLVLFFAFIWGGWAKSAAQGLFALINGEVPTADDTTTVTLPAILLLVVVMGITMASRKITRGLEFANLGSIAVQLVFLLVIDLFIVPFSVWWDGLRGLVTPALPPEGSDATLLGALAGFTALASGLNWYVMNHYRDKGYGMGSRVGYLSGLRGESQAVRPVGVIFRDTPENASRWRRWYRLLLIDLWVVFFCGAMLGMLLPTILMSHVVATTGEKPTSANVPTFVATQLGEQYGQGMFYLMLLVGVMILFSTQLGIFEALVRNFTDASHATSARLRRLLEGDPRRFYYPFMLVVLVVI